MLNPSFTDKVLGIFKRRLAPERRLTREGAELVDCLERPDGWRTFLPRIGKQSFKSEFSIFHQEFWDWYWMITYMRKHNLPLIDEKLTFIAGWGRGNAKSTTVEWGAITEGMMGLEGYVLYVSLTQASAESHVAAIRKRLENSTIGYYFPDLANPAIGKHKNRWGWRQNFLQTESGWAIRPIGLDTAVRGLKDEDLRPSLIIFDDIDTYKISPEVVETNLDTISRDILPAGTESTIQLVAQNLIAEHCAVNQIVKGESTVMADHIQSIYPAFDDIKIEKRIDRKSGEPAYEIISCKPIWEQFDLNTARINLNKLGLEAFMAEYQHDFSLDKTDRVIPEYDPDIHCITWDQFRKMFPDTPMDGYIPQHWQVGVGLDVGFTDAHISAWSWVGVSAEDSRLPNCHFRYRVKTYSGESINEQAQEVNNIIKYTDPVSKEEWDESIQYSTMKMSHEALNEKIILVREYGLLFSTAQFGKTDGVAQWRSLLRVDKRLPHPFHKDEYNETTGTWKLGRPNFFDVVYDRYEAKAKGDMAVAVHQVKNWLRVKTKVTTTGLQSDQPRKGDEDTCDSTRMILAESTLTAAPLTAAQERLAAIRRHVGTEMLELKVGFADYQGQLMRRVMELTEMEKLAEIDKQKGIALLKYLVKPPR